MVCIIIASQYIWNDCAAIVFIHLLKYIIFINQRGLFPGRYFNTDVLNVTRYLSLTVWLHCRTQNDVLQDWSIHFGTEITCLFKLNNLLYFLKPRSVSLTGSNLFITMKLHPMFLTFIQKSLRIKLGSLPLYYATLL